MLAAAVWAKPIWITCALVGNITCVLVLVRTQLFLGGLEAVSLGGGDGEEDIAWGVEEREKDAREAEGRGGRRVVKGDEEWVGRGWEAPGNSWYIGNESHRITPLWA